MILNFWMDVTYIHKLIHIKFLTDRTQTSPLALILSSAKTILPFSTFSKTFKKYS